MKNPSTSRKVLLLFSGLFIFFMSCLLFLRFLVGGDEFDFDDHPTVIFIQPQGQTIMHSTKYFLEEKTLI